VLLVLLAGLCIASVPLAGGRLVRVLELRVRWTAAVFAALALQIAITTLMPGGDPTLHDALHLASYALAGAFLIANRSIPGLWLIALGGGMNLAAISANGGVMPASPTASAIAGIPASDQFANSAVLTDPRLAWLGDIIPVPGPWPLGNVLSPGDVVLYVGALVLLHRACRPGRSRPRPATTSAALPDA
jgi:hypothetical protein